MKDEKLIRLVRNYPVLYDLSNKKYMDINFKNTVWVKIGAEMGTDGQSCKSRWSNIRDNYRKSLKKNATVTGQKAKNVKHYKYSEQLSFLKKCFKERDTRTNIDIKVTALNIKDEDISQSLFEGEENTIDTIATELDNEELQSLPSPEMATFSSPSHRKKMKQSLSTSPEATAMEYLIETNDTMSSSSSQDAVDAFLTGMAPALKKLPAQLWHYAKADIFAAVQKYEMKMLMDQQPHERAFHFSGSSTPEYYHQVSPDGNYNQPSIENVFHETSPNRSQQTTSSND